LLFGTAFLVTYTAILERDYTSIIQSAVLATVAFILAYIIYRNHLPEPAIQFVLFLPFIISIYAAIKRSQLCVTTINLAIAIAAVWAIADHVGPLYQENIQKSLLFLNGTVGLSALLTMILAAAMIERDAATKRLRNMKADFEEEKQQRTQRLENELEVRKKFERQLIDVAQRDHLTNLPNRKLLLEQMLVTFHHVNRDRLKAAILFIDLDKFKPISDRHGHEMGDRVLQVIANRLASSIRDCDLKGRWGGNEFIVVLTNLSDLEIIPSILKQIIKEIQKPIRLDTQICNLSASIGIAIYPDDAKDPLQLINKADIAMHQAKPKHTDKTVFYARTAPD